MTIFKRLLHDQMASAVAEYGLISALILIAIVTSVLQLSASLDFNSLATLVANAGR
jgi:Flp pilus assembly pilin Flp